MKNISPGGKKDNRSSEEYKEIELTTKMDTNEYTKTTLGEAENEGV